ncbi:putative protein N(5)-glutamine methyltransferase [Cryobacterium tepidiphilum]|uniref:peptide chain release factor N(5)-glutamine methyltransferase n=1 Tax=Cryobacterium tepidiphilum TaxID=2486026 RepID=A0A3M8KXY1_9MICO|nr:putative protein N(5)-glutamine methyltransferase [Cryobacterium tepidiphilum]RNE57188.1 putative protein N(5)-glutamine methyltransferase [Cryobacterium tepidiphilum]
MPLAHTAADEAAVVARLRAAGCVFAEEEAALLLAEAATPAALERMLTQRVDGTPLEHVLGWAAFSGLRIQVDPGVFVPRRRTEFLVEQAITLASGWAAPVVVDLCCGSGALGAAFVAGFAGTAKVFAADIDAASVACARRNLDPARVYQGDLYDALPTALRGRVQLLLANTPYVPSDAIATMPREARLHEGTAALDGGRDGLDVQRRVASGARDWLAPGGHLLVEAGDDQAPVAAAIFEHAGLTARIVSSEEWDATVVIGTAGTGENR